MNEEVKAWNPDDATLNQIQRANDAVTANLDDSGQPKYDSAFGYACALTAIMQTDTRTPASCSPDVDVLIRQLRGRADFLKHEVKSPGLMRQAADALESMMRRVDAMREALQLIADGWKNDDAVARLQVVRERARAALDMTLDKGR